jgi:hypothetical protein
VTELAVLIQPAAFLITQDGGTHEITRCYWQHGKYAIGSYANVRVGPYTLVGAALDDGGLTMTFSGGYTVRIPSTRLQSTHRV